MEGDTMELVSFVPKGEDDTLNETSEVDSESDDLLKEKDDSLAMKALKFTLQKYGTKKSGEEDIDRGQNALKKELTLFSAVAYVVGGIIGAGIFVTPRTILCLTGSFGLSMVMWVIGGIIAIGGSLCYIELGLLIKNSGGEYSYLKEAYSFKKKYKILEFIGSLLGFLFIWSSMLIIRSTSLSLITLTCARYLIRPFYIGCENIPESAVKLLALAILLTLALVNCYSLKLASKLMSILTVSKLLAIVFVVIIGVIFMIERRAFPESFTHPFTVQLPGHEQSVSQVSLSLYGVVWAYNGWSVMGYANEETKNVKRNLPLSLMIGIPIVTASYLLANIAFFGILTFDQMLSAQTVALPFGDVTLGTSGLVIISLLVSVSAFGSANASLFGGTRIVFVAAREGHLPDFLSGLHTTAKTPVPATILQVSLAMLMAAIGSINQLIQGFGFITLLVYGMVIAGVVILRFTRPHAQEPRLFKVWFIAPIACFMACLCGFLVLAPLFTEPILPLIALSFVLLGVPVYIFLVMDSPWKLRPKVLDKLSECITMFVNNALNTQSTRQLHPHQ